MFVYLGTPKGHNFSLKRKHIFLGSQTEFRSEGAPMLFSDFQADLFESQPEFGKKSGSNQERTQELLGHSDAYRIMFSSNRIRSSNKLNNPEPKKLPDCGTLDVYWW